MLDNLTERFARVAKTLRGEARLTESNIQDTLHLVYLDPDVKSIPLGALHSTLDTMVRMFSVQLLKLLCI